MLSYWVGRRVFDLLKSAAGADRNVKRCEAGSLTGVQLAAHAYGRVQMCTNKKKGIDTDI
jgi:hypothetical protein